MIDGDFKKLEALEEKLDYAASDNARTELYHKVGEKALALVQDGFHKETDPYGSNWAAKKYQNGRKILVDSGTLQSSFEMESSPEGFTIRNDTPYAGYHQSGTDRMVARKMIPDEGSLGDWEEPLREVMQEFFESNFGLK